MEPQSGSTIKYRKINKYGKAQKEMGQEKKKKKKQSIEKTPPQASPT